MLLLLFCVYINVMNGGIVYRNTYGYVRVNSKCTVILNLPINLKRHTLSKSKKGEWARSYEESGAYA